MSAPMDVPTDPIVAVAVPEGFVVDNEARAEWVIEILFAYDDQVARRKAALERLEHESSLAHEKFEPLLDAFFEANPPKKGKTLHLANGDLSRRTVPGGLRVEDKAKLLAWARTNAPAAVVPVFDEKLDAEVARTTLERLCAKAATAEVAAAILEAAGAVIKSDEEKLYVRAPKAKAVK